LPRRGLVRPGLVFPGDSLEAELEADHRDYSSLPGLGGQPRPVR
jgi:hypothetical protein